MADLRDFTGKNPKFTGTDAIQLPKGDTSQRPTGVEGLVRYNTQLGFMEQYNAAGWAGIDAPPVVKNQTGLVNASVDSTITVEGSNFKSGSQVYVTGAGVSNSERALSTTFVSSSQLTAATNAAAVNYVGSASYGIKVVNPSGLSAILDPAGVVNEYPVWNTSAGSVAQIYDSARGAYGTVTLSASDPDGGSITYSLVSGSVPSGMTFNSNGTITGVANAVGSNTTSNFTIGATDDEGSPRQDRAFSITVYAPVSQSFTSVGSTSWSVPTGVTSVEALVVAGGGGGGTRNSGPGTGGTDGGSGGGAGGLVYNPSFPVSPGGSVSVTVGGGGAGGGPGQDPGDNGGNSVFGNMTAVGGGGGSAGPGNQPGRAGGSGGGAGGGGGPPGSGGPGTQGPSGGGTGYGNPGGPNPNGAPYTGSGGGGAGGSGPIGGDGRLAPGGSGRSYSISGSSVAYAGGGGGGGGFPSPTRGGNGVDGGGDGGSSPNNSGNGNGGGGATNRGGGGGGGAGANWPGGAGGSGGPGIVIIKY